MRVKTRAEDGTPMCFVCGTSVEEAGQACSESCFLHFVHVVSSQGSVVEMEHFYDSALQPWSGLVADSDDEAA